HRYIYIPYKLDARYLYITDAFDTNSMHDYYILQIGSIQTPRTITTYYRYVRYKLHARYLYITDMFHTNWTHDYYILQIGSIQTPRTISIKVQIAHWWIMTPSAFHEQFSPMVV